MTHHQQAIVTGFTLANDITAPQLRDELHVWVLRRPLRDMGWKDVVFWALFAVGLIWVWW